MKKFVPIIAVFLVFLNASCREQDVEAPPPPECTQDADCAALNLIPPTPCEGYWTCESQKCAWHCKPESYPIQPGDSFVYTGNIGTQAYQEWDYGKTTAFQMNVDVTSTSYPEKLGQWVVTADIGYTIQKAAEDPTGTDLSWFASDVPILEGEVISLAGPVLFFTRSAPHLNVELPAYTPADAGANFTAHSTFFQAFIFLHPKRFNKIGEAFKQYFEQTFGENLIVVSPTAPTDLTSYCSNVSLTCDFYAAWTDSSVAEFPQHALRFEYDDTCGVIVNVREFLCKQMGTPSPMQTCVGADFERRIVFMLQPSFNHKTLACRTR